MKPSNKNPNPQPSTLNLNEKPPTLPEMSGWGHSPAGACHEARRASTLTAVEVQGLAHYGGLNNYQYYLGGNYEVPYITQTHNT